MRVPSYIENADWGDLDGDGVDEVIVCYDDETGIHGISNDGKRLWRNKSFEYVFDIDVLSATSNQPATVYIIDILGEVYSLDPKGKSGSSLYSMGYEVMSIDAEVIDNNGTIQFMGTDYVGAASAFDDEGEILWASKLYDEFYGFEFTCGDMDGDGVKDWVILDDLYSLVIISSAGMKLGSIPNQSQLVDLIVLPDPDKGDLLVTNDGKWLNAYRFSEESSETTPSQ